MVATQGDNNKGCIDTYAMLDLLDTIILYMYYLCLQASITIHAIGGVYSPFFVNFLTATDLCMRYLAY